MSDISFFFAIGKRVSIDVKLFGGSKPTDVIQVDWVLKPGHHMDNWETGCQIFDTLLLVGTLAQRSSHASVRSAGQILIADLNDLEYPASEWGMPLAKFACSISSVS